MDRSEQGNNRFQILVFGVSGVGKTTLVKQLREVSAHVFGQEVHQGRDGSYDNSSSEKFIFQEIVQFQFPSFKKLAIQRSDAFILMYDVDDHVSFDYVVSFYAEIKHVKGENAPIFVVGNRTNIPGVCDAQYEIDNCDINENLDSSHIKLCALTGDGVKDLFSYGSPC
ncbi:GTP-binding protein Di-Ras2-like [Ruditapes philippinarum]|uniref:GTP-binding protein Di-Ras2-like n=1 Tax=Ruditapes philippinarum TaxID=129788 RepID=UPI00295B3034|nr:GTP-binding protein Di-Ras2-like [Ruditapes philippinarum]